MESSTFSRGIQKLPAIASITGLILIIVVFFISMYFALSYGRLPYPSDLSQGIWSLAIEGLYLLGKVAFLSVALAAGVQLLRHGLSAGKGKEEERQ